MQTVIAGEDGPEDVSSVNIAEEQKLLRRVNAFILRAEKALASVESLPASVRKSNLLASIRVDITEALALKDSLLLE